jgi:hypothetical protein
MGDQKVDLKSISLDTRYRRSTVVKVESVNEK